MRKLSPDITEKWSSKIEPAFDKISNFNFSLFTDRKFMQPVIDPKFLFYPHQQKLIFIETRLDFDKCKEIHY